MPIIHPLKPYQSIPSRKQIRADLKAYLMPHKFRDDLTDKDLADGLEDVCEDYIGPEHIGVLHKWEMGKIRRLEGLEKTLRMITDEVLAAADECLNCYETPNSELADEIEEDVIQERLRLWREKTSKRALELRPDPAEPHVAETEQPATESEKSAPEALQPGPQHKGPDLQLSRRRLAMLKEVTSEIAKLYDDVKTHACESVDELRSRHPRFKFWELADKEEQETLLEGNPNPKYKGFAVRLVYVRHFGRSSEQVKYDRKKLRDAGEELPS